MQSPGPPYPGHLGGEGSYDERQYNPHLTTLNSSTNYPPSYHHHHQPPHSAGYPGSYVNGGRHQLPPQPQHQQHYPTHHYPTPPRDAFPVPNSPYDSRPPSAYQPPPAAARGPQAHPHPPAPKSYWTDDRTVMSAEHYGQDPNLQGNPTSPRQMMAPPAIGMARTASSGNIYTNLGHGSPQWSQSPRADGTPSPLPVATSNSRSPSHHSVSPFSCASPSSSVSQHNPANKAAANASPSHEQQQPGTAPPAPLNSHGTANPLASLQQMSQMVMTDQQDSSNSSASHYEHPAAAASPASANSSQKSAAPAYGGNEQHQQQQQEQPAHQSSASHEADSPYPAAGGGAGDLIYYNMDQNRLCTPHPASTSHAPFRDQGHHYQNGAEAIGKPAHYGEAPPPPTMQSQMTKTNEQHNGAPLKPDESTRNGTTDGSLAYYDGGSGDPSKATPAANHWPQHQQPPSANMDWAQHQQQTPTQTSNWSAADSMSQKSYPGSSYDNGQPQRAQMYSMDNAARDTYLTQNNGSNMAYNQGPIAHNSLTSQQAGSTGWDSQNSSSSSTPVVIKKKRGRPFGSKNKPKTPPADQSNGHASDSSSQATPTKANGLDADGVRVKRKYRKRNQQPDTNGEVEAVAATDAYNLNVAFDIPHKNTLTNVIPTNPSVMIESDILAYPVTNTGTGNKKKPVGPYIKVEHDKRKQQNNYSIINVNKRADEEKDGKKRPDAAIPGPSRHRPQLIGASKRKLLSPTHNQESDSILRDASWICVFCKQGPHHRGLGDLFGPYFVPIETKESAAADAAGKGKSKGSPGKRKSQQQPAQAESEKTQQEVWFHEDCISWSSGVYLIGMRMKNMEEIVMDSTETVCCKCKLTGANLGCLQKSCPSRFHFLCAKDKGCEFEEENFSIYCPKHKRKTPPSTTESSSDLL